MKRFKKTKEDFICEQCGAIITGNGYTNHCPTCLWSKHVDIYPGDRKASCRGAMKPIRIESGAKDTLYIIYKCEKCGLVKRNKAGKTDNYEAILQVIRNSQS